MKSDSIARGGLSVVGGRAVGMLFSFLLFMLLARQSEATVAIFRTSIAFLILPEFLGLLGTHRWLAVELGLRRSDRKPLFAGSVVFSLIVSIGIAAIYLILSYTGIYKEGISAGLRLVAFGAVASAFLTCIQATLVGIGNSSLVGLLNFAENVSRALIGIALILLHYSVLSIITIFVLVRWAIVILGFSIVIPRLEGRKLVPQKAIVKLFLQKTPQFAVIMAAFLVLRNAALIMLPALSGTRETALFAVPYQLYDLLLLVPTILVLTSGFALTQSANQSRASLRLAILRLLRITLNYLLPASALAIAFGTKILVFLAGNSYADATLPLAVLVIAAPLMAIDQVLSQAMVSDRQFRNDCIAVSIGAVCAVGATFVLGRSYGALGAAIALLAALIVTLIVRFCLSDRLLRARELILIIWRPVLASFFAYVLSVSLLALAQFVSTGIVRYTWPLFAVLGFALFCFALNELGGLSQHKLRSMWRFLSHNEFTRS